METLNVEVRRAGATGDGARPASDLEADLARARWLAKLLDAQFSVAGIEFGLDAIVGLIPVAGDIVTAVAALYPLHIAKKHNLGRTLQARMAWNVLVDFAAGAIPVIGDVVDVAYKANLKNLKLLERAAERRGR
jgi:hypothetical protein